MDFAAYARIWRVPALRQAIVFGLLGKAPWFGATMLLTLHVVGTLRQSYSAAGVVTAVFTLAFAVASPWRGRLLDRVGLRRTLAPSLVLVPAGFTALAVVPFWVVPFVVGIVGLFAVPWFNLTRQLVIAAVPVEDRRTALALDSVATEVAFMAGPAIGILAATYGDTRWALPVFAYLTAGSAFALWRVNPPLASEDAGTLGAAGERPRWLSRGVVGAFVATAATVFILAGQELAIVAAYRTLNAEALLALAMIAWPLGSLVGGLIYGGLPHRNAPLIALVLGLAVTTFPAALADGPWTLLPLLVLTGLFCAPAISAAAEALSHLVPESRLGEAMGWQGSMSTVGNALAPPVIGAVLDASGWRDGFWWTGVLGVAATAVTAALMMLGRRRARTPLAP